MCPESKGITWPLARLSSTTLPSPIIQSTHCGSFVFHPSLCLVADLPFRVGSQGSKLDGETGSPFSALEAGGHFLRHSEAVHDGVSVCGGSTKLPSDSRLE